MQMNLCRSIERVINLSKMGLSVFPSGNRIAKHIMSHTSPIFGTYYMRDAQGNVMATYNFERQNGIPTYKLKERIIFGSTRLEMNTDSLEMIYAPPLNSGIHIAHTIGLKQFELSNHLGNVITTISDKKLPHVINGENNFDFYQPELLSVVDYYAFGVTMPGRTFNSTNYRYGFNGKEKDDEVKGSGNSLDFGERIQDPRILRFLSLDPLRKKFPWESNYSFADNNPILYVDVDGEYKYAKNDAANYTKTYPTLTKYLSENVKQDVMQSTNIMTGLLKYTEGNLTSAEVSKATTWNSGPFIVIRDNPGGISGANGFYNPLTKTIELSTDLAKQLENASDEDKQAALFGLFTTLTHETVHYRDYLDGLRQSSDDPSGFGGEPGSAFVSDVFDSKTVDVDGEKVGVPQGHNSANIDDAKKMIQLNKDEGKSDIILTVPSKNNKTTPKDTPPKKH